MHIVDNQSVQCDSPEIRRAMLQHQDQTDENSQDGATKHNTGSNTPKYFQGEHETLNLNLNLDIKQVEEEQHKLIKMHQEISGRMTNSQTHNTGAGANTYGLSSADTSRRVGHQGRPELASEQEELLQYSNF